MVKVLLVVRKIGNQEPDYYLPFDLAAVPSVGDYISVFRPDTRTQSEDFIVRHVWWHLNTPQEFDSKGEPHAGNLSEIMIECDVAIGPYLRRERRKWAELAITNGSNVERFDVQRFAFPEK